MRSIRRHRAELRREIESSRTHIRESQQTGVGNQPLGRLSVALDYAELAVLLFGDVADTVVLTFGVYLVLALPILLALIGASRAAGVATLVEAPLLLFKSRNRR